jgi:hypothetical protein
MMSLLEQTVEHLEVEGISRLKLIYEHFKPVHVAFEGAVDQLPRDDCQDKLLALCKKQARILRDLLISDGRVSSTQLVIDFFDGASPTGKHASSQLRRSSLYFLAFDACRLYLSECSQLLEVVNEQFEHQLITQLHLLGLALFFNIRW